MDTLFRDCVFAGISDRDMVETLIVEMRRRKLLGCVYLFPEAGGAGIFASSTPAGTMLELTAAQQLSVFAEVATYAQAESKTILPDETDTSFNPKGYVN